jgi:hypothetical protein
MTYCRRNIHAHRSEWPSRLEGIREVLDFVTKRFVDLVTEAKGHTQDFLLWPRRWRLYPGHDLDWEILKFTKSGLRNVPNEPGVYAFLLQPRLESSLEVSYLLYVGMSTKSLKVRCKTYLIESCIINVLIQT